MNRPSGYAIDRDRPRVAHADTDHAGPLAWEPRMIQSVDQWKVKVAELMVWVLGHRKLPEDLVAV
jgi:hypothetical protein